MRAFVAKILAGALAGALAFGAVAMPMRVSAQGVPSYGQPAPAAEETIHGRIEAIQGPYAIVVLDDRGFLDTVSLRPGTIINPRGLRLAVGMTVTIVGYNAGASFAAIEIDAPYAYEGSSAGSDAYGTYGYYDYGLAAGYDLGLVGFFGAPTRTAPAVPGAPRTGVPRRIEPPKPGHPIRRPLDEGSGSAPNRALPSYALPVVTSAAPSGAAAGIPSYRGVPALTPEASVQARGSAPGYRAPSAPVRVEPRSEAPRSEAPRAETPRAEAPRSEPSRSEPSRSAPAPSSSSSRSH